MVYSPEESMGESPPPLSKHGDEEEDDDDKCDGQNESWEDWEEDGDDEFAENGNIRCLFCTREFSGGAAFRANLIFEHCLKIHDFDFGSVVKQFKLDIYGAIRLINYIRSKVAEDKDWSWNQKYHLTEINHDWEDDIYLKPYLSNDPLLHNLPFDDDDDDDEDTTGPCEHEEQLANCEPSELGKRIQNVVLGNGSATDGLSKNEQFKPRGNDVHSEEDNVNKEIAGDESVCSLDTLNTEKQYQVTRADVKAKEIKIVDDGYFGSYSSFKIHRTMLSDKPRTEAYRDALLNNPSLMNGATVMDVGCGTGILSLFAARGGALKVVAVEASSRMAATATQIAERNGLLAGNGSKSDESRSSGVVTVVNTMIENLDKLPGYPRGGFDVLVSEWMGYCLLYESMLSSVLYARDHFLKPGGAILPDTATIFGAGFGRGATSLPFWENVYGFDMFCVGVEATKEASSIPIVDIVDPRDIVTEPSMLHTFDLATMKPSEIDFTASFELRAKQADSAGILWCYGIVLWFETGFTSRFCKEKPTVLSTSPLDPETHWSQTIFTFREPIAMAAKPVTGSPGNVGTAASPAETLRSRISIVRASAHRSIDISIEVVGIGFDGRRSSWPVQMFTL